MDKACCTAGGVFSLQVLDHCVELVSTSGSAVPWTPWGPSTDSPSGVQDPNIGGVQLMG